MHPVVLNCKVKNKQITITQNFIIKRNIFIAIEKFLLMFLYW